MQNAGRKSFKATLIKFVACTLGVFGALHSSPVKGEKPIYFPSFIGDFFTSEDSSALSLLSTHIYVEIFGTEDLQTVDVEYVFTTPAEFLKCECSVIGEIAELELNGTAIEYFREFKTLKRLPQRVISAFQGFDTRRNSEHIPVSTFQLHPSSSLQKLHIKYVRNSPDFLDQYERFELVRDGYFQFWLNSRIDSGSVVFSMDFPSDFQLDVPMERIHGVRKYSLEAPLVSTPYRYRKRFYYPIFARKGNDLISLVPTSTSKIK